MSLLCSICNENFDYKKNLISVWSLEYMEKYDWTDHNQVNLVSSCICNECYNKFKKERLKTHFDVIGKRKYKCDVCETEVDYIFDGNIEMCFDCFKAMIEKIYNKKTNIEEKDNFCFWGEL